MGFFDLALDDLFAEEGEQRPSARSGPEGETVSHAHYALHREQALDVLETGAVFADDAVE
ncbi:hypothetical protein SDC9_112606 [bioreactor metagenome]|uniref:Uncharacterized protein n=1 Tax=bioreactor metagenome TaxID=1076179 RepID=A0A645BKD7_9ZZZZ